MHPPLHLPLTTNWWMTGHVISRYWSSIYWQGSVTSPCHQNSICSYQKLPVQSHILVKTDLLMIDYSSVFHKVAGELFPFTGFVNIFLMLYSYDYSVYDPGGFPTCTARFHSSLVVESGPILSDLPLCYRTFTVVVLQNNQLGVWPELIVSQIFQCSKYELKWFCRLLEYFLYAIEMIIS